MHRNLPFLLLLAFLASACAQKAKETQAKAKATVAFVFRLNACLH